MTTSHKYQYQPPKVAVVAFSIEKGFAGSGQQGQESPTQFNSTENNALDAYQQADGTSYFG